ncbi:MAG: PTS fructose transporter subunit IIA [Candidatus Thiodiazotropha endolucinida]|uniref:PTS system mannose-specific EIIAB component n=2 Tax=Candidatus Thiodiazotropha TaxID=1913444 RepID=A0A7Z0VML6_9GAMM|nr:PTS fructose transporter subunit IIA [Candidatus Thiodiazotropha endolucinida]MBT3017124.1 PTS fructose transporter subunit IIA [Candidatus Thiodiazotropha taylori]MBT3030167.1 PTS fructose transporter subunit IIA [Candidatus Thiodiazotropha sp. (ex Lucina pensylvanica)]MBT3040678.1 PTS fructose transporter subunit IIA [Candidatus Thiodiazotropha sp. (ex Codakia orbicularis)]MBT3044185.1 PTS fructose transporter subunit IIA [Candidatus Thiodiazotropha sp. (ex Codakia orbicularis)]MBT3051894
MTIGLLLITHSRIGEAMLETAGKMLEGAPLAVEILPVGIDSNPEKLVQQASGLIERLDQGRGVLVFTDMYGSTPSNIAYSLAEKGRVNVISGINLPMLIRTLNYQTMDLDGLTEKAVSGGKEGIICCETLKR